MFDGLNNLNIETKTQRIISLILTFIGIIFILAAKYIGFFAMRLGMIAVFILCLLNFKMTYKYSTTKEKINHMIGVIGSVLVFVKPQLIMLIFAAGILFFTFPIIYKAVRAKDYSDKIMLSVSLIGIIFSLFCILNSRAALNTVITIVGIAFVVVGCLIMYEDLDKNKKSKNKKEKDFNIDEQERFGFEEVE